MTEQPSLGPGGLTRAYLLVLVTITGAVVLALEVLGTRVIGACYGSSLYVWTALLSVTMVCLAVGYAVGGQLADRIPRPWMLYLLVILAGGSVLAVPRLAGILEPLAERFGLTWGAIVSALIIFAVPLTLLATAGPYVIRLRARRVEGVGSTSGAVYALSTIGSVGGVLAVSLWMIPALGTRTSLLLCASLLIGWAGVGLLISAARSAGRTAGAIVLLASAGPLLGGMDREPPVPGELYYTESPYGDLRVVQRTDAAGRTHRMLMVNGIMQTGMPLDIDLVGAGRILQSDHYHLELLPYFHPDLGDGRRGVLIGLAGGMFPRVMEFHNIHWTAVEIDVKVAELARAYFDYRGQITWPDGSVHAVDLDRFPNRNLPARDEPDDGPVHSHRPGGPYPGRAVIQDGRRYLAANPEPADFIVVDAYSSDTIPFHLITREFFELVRSRLAADGILAINYIGPPGEDFVTDSLFRTLGAVFGPRMLSAWRSTRDESAVQVITVMAFMQPMELSPLWQTGTGFGGVDEFSYELEDRRISTDRAGGMVVTDDHNPIDLARARTALQWRRQTRIALER